MLKIIIFFVNRTEHSWKLHRFYEQPKLMNPAKIEAYVAPSRIVAHGVSVSELCADINYVIMGGKGCRDVIRTLCQRGCHSWALSRTPAGLKETGWVEGAVDQNPEAATGGSQGPLLVTQKEGGTDVNSANGLRSVPKSSVTGGLQGEDNFTVK